MGHPPAAVLSEGHCGSKPTAWGMGGHRPHSPGRYGRPAGATHGHEPWVLGDPPLWGAGPIWSPPPLQPTCLPGPGTRKEGSGGCRQMREHTRVHTGNGTHKHEGGTHGNTHGCAAVPARCLLPRLALVRPSRSTITQALPMRHWEADPLANRAGRACLLPGAPACWPRVPAPQAQGWAHACQWVDVASPNSPHRQVSRALRPSSPPPLALP